MDKFQLKHSIFFFLFGLVLCPLVLKLAKTPLVAADGGEEGAFNYLKLATEAAEAEDVEEAEPIIDYLKLQTVQPVVAADSNAFDYYRLALQWAPSAWKLSGTAPERFTIHGLWPDNKSGGYLAKCNPSHRYKTITDPKLLARMKSNWPNLEKNDNVKFWSYEWITHGTCSGLNQTPYLTLALNLYRSYDILAQLKSDNIVPDKNVKYAVSNIKNSVKSLTSGNPDILCISGQVKAIRICLNPSSPYKVIDCPSHHSAKCSGNVKLPSA